MASAKLGRIRDKIREFTKQAQSIKTVADAENVCMTCRELWGAFFPDWEEYLADPESVEGVSAESLLKVTRSAVEQMKVASAEAEDVEYRDHAAASCECRANALEALINGRGEGAAMVELEGLLSI